jgi:hypothetical protein
LAEWRGKDWSAEERAQAVGERSAAVLVAQVVRDLKLDQRRSDAEVLKAWGVLVSPTVAAHTRPMSIRSGVLTVAVDSSAWLSEIVHFRQAEILTALQGAFGAEAVRQILYRSG